MSLISSKLENVRPLKDGGFIARCPACAAEGHDNTGNHLIVYADGRFGCAVAQGEGEEAREHRRKIWKLAGDGKAVNVRSVSKKRYGRLVITPWRSTV